MFSDAVCDDLVAQLAQFAPERWYCRRQIRSKPTQGTTACHYYFCGDRQQPAAFQAYLRSLAPVIPGARLAESIINRYDVGDYLPEHIDHALYRYNVVVTLTARGDGVCVNGVWVPDVKGRALVFPAKSAPHAVPPVTNPRFVAIYLYE